MNASIDGCARRAALHRVLWRLHSWVGLIGAPLERFAALTGLRYVFSPQIEAWGHGALEHGPVGLRAVLLDEQAAAPDGALRFVVPAHQPGDSTQIHLSAPHQHHRPKTGGEHDHGLPTGSIVYFGPYTGQVLGQLTAMQRFKTWARKLHSSALQGDGWRWIVELGLVRSTVQVTGSTSSRHRGEQFRAMQQALGKVAPKPPKALISAPGDGPPLNWRAAWDRARANAPAAGTHRRSTRHNFARHRCGSGPCWPGCRMQIRCSGGALQCWSPSRARGCGGTRVTWFASVMTDI